MVTAPGHPRTRQQSVEEAPVEIVKDLLQMIVIALGAFHSLTPPHLPDQMSLGRHGLAPGELPIARRECGIDRLAIQLGQQDMQDGVQHRLGRALEQIGQADQHPPLAQADGAVEIGKREEADFKLRQRCFGMQLAKSLLEEGGEIGIHVDFSFRLWGSSGIVLLARARQ